MNKKTSILLINLINLKSGGGLHILDKILNATVSDSIFDQYYILVRCDFDEEVYRNYKNIKFIKTNNIFEISYLFFLREYLLIPYLTFRYKPDALFTFSDLPSLSTCRQYLFYDWAFATIDSKKIFKKYNMFEKFERVIKLNLFRITCSLPALYFCHLKCHAIELERISGRKVVHKFPYLDQLEGKPIVNIRTNPEILIYPALPFPHKNFQILANLVEKYDIPGLGFRISVTLTYAEFINLIDSNESESYFSRLGIEFLGRMSKIDLTDYYLKTSAIIFPSYVESLGIPLLEAMKNCLPVLVSDLPYAREVCGNYAVYFDPDSEVSLYEAICKLHFVDRELLKRTYSKMHFEDGSTAKNEFSFFVKYIFENISDVK